MKLGYVMYASYDINTLYITLTKIVSNCYLKLIAFFNEKLLIKRKNAQLPEKCSVLKI